MERRCLACMNRIETNVCTRCGNDNADLSSVSHEHLTPGIIVKERFYVGLVVEQNGEGMTYIAYDILEKKRVRLREYFPDTMCERSLNGKDVKVTRGFELQYKSLMDDFTELGRQLTGLKVSNCLVRATMFFYENYTAYTVYEDVTGITLTRYLKENGGNLAWEETENLFLPLLYTIKLLNANGIIHRGISPETIIVTPDYELKLTGVCTSGARANTSEIRPELYVGYAAPEQYQKCISYGEWTDVYSLSAVLYKVLTGTMPPRSDLRDPMDRLVTPIQLDASIPKTVSDAVSRGLAFEQNRRTHSVRELISELYAAAPSDGRGNTDDVAEEAPMGRKRRLRVPIWLIVILVTLPLMLLLFFYMYEIILGDKIPQGDDSSVSYSSDLPAVADPSSSEATDSSQTEESEPSSADSGIMNIAVYNFVDKYYEDIMASSAYAESYKFKKLEEYNDFFDEGMVFEQTPEADTITKVGVEVTLKVSLGAKIVTVPPYNDLDGSKISLDLYKEVLEDIGLVVKVEQVSEPAYSPNEIIRASVEPGGTIDRSVSKEITVYVAV